MFHIAREMNPECRKKHKTKGPLQDVTDQAAPLEDGQSPLPSDHAVVQTDVEPPLVAECSPDLSPATMQHLDPSLADATTAADALQTTSRLEVLERENAMLHERLHQQDAEIDYLRQAYNDLLARINRPSALNGFRA